MIVKRGVINVPKLKHGKEKDFQITAICIGALSAMLITLLLVAIGGIFIQNEYLGFNKATLISMGIQGVSVLAGAIITSMQLKNNRLLSCILVSAIYFSVLICIALLFFEGLKTNAVVSVFICFIAAILAAFISQKGQRSVRVRNKRKRHC